METTLKVYSLIQSLRVKLSKYTRNHSRRTRTDRAVTRMTSDWAAMRLIVDRQTTVKTLPSLAVGNQAQGRHIFLNSTCPRKHKIRKLRVLCAIGGLCAGMWEWRSELSQRLKWNNVILHVLDLLFLFFLLLQKDKRHWGKIGKAQFENVT